MQLAVVINADVQTYHVHVYVDIKMNNNKR